MSFLSIYGKVYIFLGGVLIDNVADVTISVYGNTVSNAGDINGDGFGDIIVGAPGYPYAIGKAYIYYRRNGSGQFP